MALFRLLFKPCFWIYFRKQKTYAYFFLNSQNWDGTSGPNHSLGFIYPALSIWWLHWEATLMIWIGRCSISRKTCTWFGFVCQGYMGSYLWIHIMYIPIIFRNASLVLGCSYDCRSAIKVTQGLFSLCGKTSYRQISWSLVAARLGFNRFEIWQSYLQPWCLCACQILEQSGNSKYKSRGFATSRYLATRRVLSDIKTEPCSLNWMFLKQVYIRSV